MYELTHLLTDNIFRCFFVNKFFSIWIKISLKFAPKGPTDSNQALVQMMAWHWPGNKPLSEPMLVCFTDAYMRDSAAISSANQHLGLYVNLFMS